ncbi:MAG: hypothetical protein WBZ36_08705 [Candidatus Nitrosopolaris sp.]
MNSKTVSIIAIAAMIALFAAAPLLATHQAQAGGWGWGWHRHWWGWHGGWWGWHRHWWGW